MGHRALVAYRRPDGRYDLRYSHWGAEGLAVADVLSPDAPLAGGLVDPGLRAGAVAFGRVLADHLDPVVYEALYLVSPAFTVRSYRVLSLAFEFAVAVEPRDDRDGARGAIVEVDAGSGPEDVALRAWVRGVRTTLADAIEMDVLSRPAALSYLEARLTRDRGGQVYTYDGP